ncbi:MAG: hypothetical protein ABL901_08525 [Hyphomicrobiaceae bacterium]
MLYDWSHSESEPEKFPFWSKMELIRVGVVAGLAIVPVSVSAIDAPKQTPVAVQRNAEPSPGHAGRLLSTRHVNFDVKSLDLAALGDTEPEKTR